MIPRYSRPEMVAIWSEENRLRIMLEIELLACEAMAELGEVPEAAAAVCRERADFDVDRVNELEKTLKHDVIAFLTAVNEHIGDEGRFLHKGMTSSDVLDTATAVQLKQAGELILKELQRVLETTRRRAFEWKDTPCIGRSHGIHAEPTTFGLKLASWYDELVRARARLESAVADISVGMISGAVGTYAFVNPQVESRVCERLGIQPAPISTQVIPRDRHAAYFAALGLLASSIERFAVEVRHLQRTEVLEAEERFTKGQKGSSAMPHKRNPILSENLTGLARLVRGYSIPAMENVALWHERDISHSSVERVIGPDATTAAHFMLVRFHSVIDGLVVYPENMQRNLDQLGGIHYSQRLMLALVEAGMTREEAYALVQRNAMRVWQGEGDLRALIEADTELSSRLDSATIESVFDPDAFVRNRDHIFERVFAD
ncbi:MAG: adenylosuccinate lyase [Deltaproteobacteria bacterium]|nr:adenylosuccinate lyase [Deltaproteobacteria bacterium]